MAHLVAAQRGVVGEEAFGLLALAHHGGGDGPVLAQIDAEREAGTDGVDFVVVVAGAVGVVLDDARGRVGAFGIDVVDVAGVALLPADQADGRVLGHRHVDEALGHVADAAVLHRVQLQPVAGREVGRVGLAGDQLDRAGLRAGAVQRALRAGQRFHALQVVDVQVQRALDGGDRLLVQIDAHAGQRGGVVAVAAAGHAAHVDLAEAGAAGRDRHAGQQLGVVLEVVDLQLVELLGADHVEADRHVLRILGALLRGDGDGVERGGLVLVALRILGHGLCGHAGAGDQDGGAQGQAPGRARMPERVVLAVCHRALPFDGRLWWLVGWNAGPHAIAPPPARDTRR